MKILFFILVLTLPKRFCSYSNFDTKSSHLLDDEWELFKHEHNKLYSNHFDHETHELKRRLIWETNMKKINLHNIEYAHGKRGHLLKMNALGDLTHEEFIQRNGFLPLNVNHTNKHTVQARYKRYMSNPPISIDWRTRGRGYFCINLFFYSFAGMLLILFFLFLKVTSVKDQGQCGSCWAFSAIASLEGQFARSSNRLLSLSAQNIIDCAKSGSFLDKNGVIQPIPSGYYNNFSYTALGCGGGNYDAGFQYYQYNGVELNSDYPYVAQVIFLKFYLSLSQ